MGCSPTGSKNINKLIRKAEKQGWKQKKGSGKRGHLIYLSPDRKTMVIISVSPKDKSSTKKVESDFRRGGLKL